MPAAVFTAGYVLVWTLYAALAAGVQWELHRRMLLSPAMASASPALSGGLLVAAGLYQWLPVKRVCLSHCRSPLGFFSSEWREGVWGALSMGVRHGSFCVGCCWLLMALLFVARGDECAVGGGDRGARARGEARAGWRVGGASGGGGDGGMGGVADWRHG